MLSVPPGLVCLLFFLCLASSNRDGGAGRPGIWEVRLCAPGRGHDGAVYGKSEAEVRPEIQLERRKGGEEEGGSSWMVEMQKVILHVSGWYVKENSWVLLCLASYEGIKK